MSKKKISQVTFDETVKENMEEFELEAADALKEAINQFRMQGIDLSNLDLSGGIGRKEVLDLIERLAIFSTNLDSSVQTFLDDDCNNLFQILSKLSDLCDHRITKEYYKRNLNLILEKDAIKMLYLLLEKFTSSDKIVNELFKVLKLMSKGNVMIRDQYEVYGRDICPKLLQMYSSQEQWNLLSLCNGLSFCRVVAKSECNKVALMKKGVADTAIQLLSTLMVDQSKQSHQVIIEICKLIRGLCIADDTRNEMSCAYENGKYFLKQTGLVSNLIQLSQQYQTHIKMATLALQAARNLITTEEAVQIMAQHGAMSLPLQIMQSNLSAEIVRSALGLMRNLCNDDVRKDRLVSDGTLDTMIACINLDQYAGDHFLMEHALACFAAMSLRSPSNAERIVTLGGIDSIVRSMHRHATYLSLQRQGCLAIRNIAARSLELKNSIIDAGVETVLRSAGKYSTVTDEAYAALRDLNFDVQYVKVTQDGMIEPAFEQFGSQPKLNFNPIYDEEVDISDRIRKEARPPMRIDEGDEENYDSDDELEKVEDTVMTVQDHHNHNHDHHQHGNGNDEDNHSSSCTMDHAHGHEHGHGHDH